MKYYDDFIFFLSNKAPGVLKLMRNFTLMEWFGLGLASAFILLNLV